MCSLRYLLLMATCAGETLLMLSPDLKAQRLTSVKDSDCFTAFGAENNSLGYSFCYPSIIVAGFPKCGTSFMFKTLSEHPQLRATRRKEMCYGGVKSEHWTSFTSQLAVAITDTSPPPMLLSGCLHLGANIEAASSLQAGKTKYVFTTRNIPDMLWASYNYWCIPGSDKLCSPGQRTNKGHTRSPEDFHTRVMTGQPMGGGLRLGREGNCFKPLIKRAVHEFGKENVIVVKSENFSPSRSEEERLHSMRSLLLLLGLNIPGNFQNSFVSSSALVNAGHNLQNRGEFAKSSLQTQDAGNVYEISDFKPMLTSTRRHLDNIWATERRWLRNHYDIDYDELTM